MPAQADLRHSLTSVPSLASSGTLKRQAVAVSAFKPNIAFNRGNLRNRPRPSPASPTIDFIEIRQDTLPGPLEELVESTDDLWISPFQCHSWLDSWRLAQSGGFPCRPVTAIGYCGNKIAFILPLAVFKRYGARCLSWYAYQISDYCAPVVNLHCIEAFTQCRGDDLLRQIARSIGGIDLIYIPKQLQSVSGHPNPFVTGDAFPYHAGAHAISFQPGETWKATLARRRSAKTRGRLNSKRNALEKLGHVGFHLAATCEDARMLIGTCLSAKSEQLGKAGHWDPFSPPGIREHLINYFSSRVGQSTWVATFEIDGQPLATAFGFRDERNWLLYQMAMTCGPNARYSPGTHLLMELMKHCIGLGVSRLDLALGDESYKAEWCDENSKLMVSTIGITTKGAILARVIRLRAHLRKYFSSNPKLYDRAKWVKGMAKRLWLPV